MKDCIFCKIARRDIPKEFKYEDDDVLAFDDIHPVSPFHVLVIPKKHIDEIYSLDNPEILNAIHKAVKKLIEKYNIMGKGYRIEINGGGAQLVNHLHVHLMSPVKPATTH